MIQPISRSRPAAQVWFGSRQRISRSSLPSVANVNLQLLNGPIITCLWLDTTNTTHPLLSLHSSIKQGEGRKLLQILAIWEEALISVLAWLVQASLGNADPRSFFCLMRSVRIARPLRANVFQYGHRISQSERHISHVIIIENYAKCTLN